MVDTYGRRIDYLRVSVTDRCNLRCVYCMPERGVEEIPHSQILTYEEILRLCGLLAQKGIRRVRLTGGEPLVRKGVAGLVRALKATAGIEGVFMTTNGALLGEQLEALTDAGLDGLNISIDAIDPDIYRNITRRQGPAETLEALRQAVAAGIAVKVNCVPVKTFNENELAAIAALARDLDITVRFIELMPFGGGALEPIPTSEVFEILERAYGPLTPLPGSREGGPAACYEVKGFRGKVGFISAISRRFCQNCNRLRLTPEGFILPCLASDLRLDVKTLLRGGTTDEELSAAIDALVAKKPAGHKFAATRPEQRTGLFSIGG